MRNKIFEHINDLFADAELTVANAELKEELLNDTLAHYDDMVASGMEEAAAYRRAVSQIGDVSELINAKKQASMKTAKVETNTSTYNTINRENEQSSSRNSQNSYGDIYESNASYKGEKNEKFEKEKESVNPNVSEGKSTYDDGLFEQDPKYSKTEFNKRRNLMSGGMLAVAVILYICSVIPPICADNVAGTIGMFVMVAIATGLIIVRNYVCKSEFEIKAESKKEVNFQDSDEKGSKNANGKKKADSVVNKILKLIKTLIDIGLTIGSIAAYIAISAVFGAWHYAWIIFLIAVAIGEVADGILELIGGILTNEG